MNDHSAALAPHAAPPEGARCALHPDRLAASTCARCGSFACDACTLPGEGGAPRCRACDAHAAGDIPWERRAELGVPRAFLETAIAIFLRPHVFFAQRPREASVLPALLFGFAFAFPATCAVGLGNLVSQDRTREQLLAMPFTRDLAWLASPWYTLANVLLSPLTYLLSLGLYAGVWWVSLFVVRGVRRPFLEIVRALAYLHATSFVMIVLSPVTIVLSLLGLEQLAGLVFLPFLAYYMGMAIVAMHKVQGVELWRPVAATGLQIVVALSCACVLAVALVALFAASLGFPLS